jgi:hypothetical protein
MTEDGPQTAAGDGAALPPLVDDPDVAGPDVGDETDMPDPDPKNEVPDEEDEGEPA